MRDSHKTVSMHRPQPLKWKESRSRFEPRSLCLPAYHLTARPNRRAVHTPLKSDTGTDEGAQALTLKNWDPHPPPPRPPHTPSASTMSQTIATWLQKLFCLFLFCCCLQSSFRHKVQWSSLFFLPGFSYLEPTPCFCPSFCLCQFF